MSQIISKVCFLLSVGEIYILFLIKIYYRFRFISSKFCQLTNIRITRLEIMIVWGCYAVGYRFMTTSWWVLAGSTFSVESAYIMWFNLRSALNNNKVWFPAWDGSKKRAQSSSPFLFADPKKSIHAIQLLLWIYYVSLKKCTVPITEILLGLPYPATTQCKPLSARQQNVIRMAFSWRADGGPILDVYWVNTQITTKPLHGTTKTNSNPDKLKHRSSHTEQNMGQQTIFWYQWLHMYAQVMLTYPAEIAV